MKEIGKEIGADWEQLKLVQGYDHNLVLDKADGSMREVAEARDPKYLPICRECSFMPATVL